MTPGSRVYITRGGAVLAGTVIAARHLVTVQIDGGPVVERAPVDVYRTEGGARGAVDAARALIRRDEIARFRRAHATA